MTRTTRLLAIVLFVVAVAIVGALFAALFGSLGPLELLIVLVLSVPLTTVLVRAARTVLPGGRGRHA